MTPAETRSEAAAAPAIDLRDVQFSWPAASGGPSFRLGIPAWRVERGARVALLGASGSGKTTLLNLLAGVARAESGTVAILGQDLGRLSPGARDRFRGDHIGLIFQMFNLLPFASVLDNVLLPLRFSARRRKKAGADPAATARALLEALDVPADRLAAPVSALSVGQQQRVAAARALIGAPELIIADEPTSALDAERRDRFLALLFEEVAAAGATLLTVTHDERVAAAFDRTARLEELTGAASAPTPAPAQEEASA